MSVDSFRAAVKVHVQNKNDQTWFPRWVARYAEGKGTAGDLLPVNRDLVLAFSRELLKSGTPAWQRLQAVRAIESYRDLILKSDLPQLDDMRQVLSRLASRERQSSTALPTGIDPGDDRDIAGIIDPTEPQILQTMRRELRVRRLALETERAYVGWIQRFMRFCGSEQLADFGDAEIRGFLTSLAVDATVAASTQDQAKSALLFLYQQVLSRELPFLNVVRADKPRRLPVALSRQEIALILPEFQGLRRLMFLLMYGAGLRHKECRRLRVKDICFDEGHLIVRSGKGDKDRISVLPECCRSLLMEQGEKVADSPDAGFFPVYDGHEFFTALPAGAGSLGVHRTKQGIRNEITWFRQTMSDENHGERQDVSPPSRHIAARFPSPTVIPAVPAMSELRQSTNRISSLSE